jgi:hypothetical protein
VDAIEGGAMTGDAVRNAVTADMAGIRARSRGARN